MVVELYKNEYSMEPEDSEELENFASRRASTHSENLKGHQEMLKSLIALRQRMITFVFSNNLQKDDKFPLLAPTIESRKKAEAGKGSATRAELDAL